MRFHLSTMLLALTIVALALGWWRDRQRLIQANQRLNAECAELFHNQTEIIDLTSGDEYPLHRTGRVSRRILYDANDAVDRQNYRDKLPPKIMDGKN